MQVAQQADFKAFDASSWKIAMVVAQFNSHITEEITLSALKKAKEYSIPEENISIIQVAGAVEIPLILQKLAKTKKYQALLAIGCIIRGDTPHFDYVAKIITEGFLKVQLDNNQPIGFGVLTCNDEAQALARVNLGGEYLSAVLNQAKALQSIS
jgi:6,7-dimethyl-8-ribityllumazine synthase